MHFSKYLPNTYLSSKYLPNPYICIVVVLSVYVKLNFEKVYVPNLEICSML